ncbi:MAG TPA: hypothetical protein VIC34_03850 [Croceibacterium sp.]|jgi:hypothetical protein
MRAKAIAVKSPQSGSALRFAPLGIPVAIIADDPTLLHAAVANFAGLTRHTASGDVKISIRLRWNDLATTRVGFAISAKGSCLTIEGDGILGRADAATRTAECSLSRAYGADRQALAEIGETLLLFLLTKSGRAPIHAAAVMFGETAVLLAGRSGSGKSSLALAAQRRGLEVLSEDTTYVQLAPRLTVWGWPGAIHLHPADAPPGDFPQRRRGGRVKTALPRELTRHCAERVVLVAIVPGDTLRLRRVAAGRLLTLLSPSEPGFSLLRREIDEALRELARSGAWRLTLNKDPDEAIAILRERFGAASLVR